MKLPFETTSREDLIASRDALLENVERLERKLAEANARLQDEEERHARARSLLAEVAALKRHNVNKMYPDRPVTHWMIGSFPAELMERIDAALSENPEGQGIVTGDVGEAAGGDGHPLAYPGDGKPDMRAYAEHAREAADILVRVRRRARGAVPQRRTTVGLHGLRRAVLPEGSLRVRHGDRSRPSCGHPCGSHARVLRRLRESVRRSPWRVSPRLLYDR